MTVPELISLARGHFDSFDSGEALTYLQTVHNRILQKVRVKTDENIDVSLVAGTYRYSISVDIIRIWAVTYFTSATVFRELEGRSVDELDANQPLWRQADNGTPLWYDERAGELLLHPTPDTTTSSGYPKVTIACQKKETLTTQSSSTLPTTVSDHEAWLYGVCRRYAAMKAPEKVKMFAALEEEAMRNLMNYTHGKAARLKSNVRPNVPRPRIS